MAIESAANLRGLLRTGLVIALGLFSLSDATAQKEMVSTGSVIPLPLGLPAPCQIYKIINAPNGDTVMLDVCGGGGYGSIYQLKKGATTPQVIVSAIDSSGTYWNEGMTMDAKGTLYLTDRYSGSQHIYRIPYNPSDGSWDYSPSGSNWYPQLAGGFAGAGTVGISFSDNPAKDGSGLLIVSEETANAIVIVPVNADGTIPNFSSGAKSGASQYQYLINGLTSKVMPMDVDVNRNLYFIENPYVTSANRSTGVFFVPSSVIASCVTTMQAGTSPDTPCISGTESSLQRIDPGNSEKFNGITHDAAGNIYVGDSSDSYSGTRNGLLMIPNESGSPIGVTATSFNFEHAEWLAPIPINANPAIDYRGFLWLPTGGTGNWSPGGSGQIAGTGNVVLWQPGTANLGSTPVGTAATPGVVFFTFSGTVTPASIGFAQPNGETDFVASTTNPNPPPSGTTPAVPCTAGTTYNAFSTCQYWVALDPSGPNAVGSVQGQIAMLDSSSNPIGGSTAYLQGIGLGPESATLIPALQTPLATSLVQPAQVAGDSLGNAYVADPGQHAVLLFPAGSTTAFGGAPIGTGLVAPTGVAVDGSGDIYIADSGKVIEIPANVPNPVQTTLATGLGSNVQLAVDGGNNIYAADPNNARVVRIFNPQASMMLEGTNTVGTGFAKPTAVAVDDAGDVFVADGSNLVEVNAWGGQTAITSSLASPVTGLAVDPSGSVYVAQSGGVIRIPMGSSGLNANNAAGIDNTGVTAPTGLGLDGVGNVYVTANSYNVTTMNTSGTPLGPVTNAVNTPNVLMLANASVNFGVVDTATTTDPSDISVYNIGNAPLMFSTTTPPAFSGTNASDYAVQQDGQNPCDTTGATAIVSGTACTLGVAVTAANTGLSQGTLTIATNAINTPTQTAALAAYSENNLCRTSTTITLNPSTGVIYPGSTSVAATVAALDPTCAPGKTPTGGKISLTLAPQTKGAAQIVLNSTVNSGAASFSATGLNGGTYNVYASYKGDPVYGGSSSSKTYTFTVAQAASTTTLSTPGGVSPINGVYFVKQGSTTTMTATVKVTSKTGAPTGTVTFMNGSQTLGTSPLNASGTATFDTSGLAAGPSTSQLGQTYNITAVYSGDLNFASTTSAASPIEVVPASALITASPATIQTTAGTPVQTTLTITPLEGYSPKAGATLYCDNTTLPKYSECTFDVPTLDLYDAAGKPVTSHVTISTNLPVNVGAVRRGPSPIEYASLFGLGVLGLALRRKTRLNVKLFTSLCVLLLAASMAGLGGCTNSGYTHTPPSPQYTTPSGTSQVSIYTIDLTNNQRSSLPFTVTLTVQ